MQAILYTFLHFIVVFGMILSLRWYFNKEVTLTTRSLFHKNQKHIRGEAAQKFGMYSFIGYLIMFLTLLMYTIIGSELGYWGLPFCILGFIPIFGAFYVVRNES